MDVSFFLGPRAISAKGEFSICDFSLASGLMVLCVLRELAGICALVGGDDRVENLSAELGTDGNSGKKAKKPTSVSTWTGIDIFLGLSLG